MILTLWTTYATNWSCWNNFGREQPKIITVTKKFGQNPLGGFRRVGVLANKLTHDSQRQTIVSISFVALRIWCRRCCLSGVTTCVIRVAVLAFINNRYANHAYIFHERFCIEHHCGINRQWVRPSCIYVVYTFCNKQNDWGFVEKSWDHNSCHSSSLQ